MWEAFERFMVPAKNIRFDCYLSGLKAQSFKPLCEAMSARLSPLCGVQAGVLSRMIQEREESGNMQTLARALVVDVQSVSIKAPAMILCALDPVAGFSGQGAEPVEIVAGVLSTRACGPRHLQKLSKVSRLVRSDGFCDSVQSCADAEAMAMMFMPDQKLVSAA